jgi:hypothetical protein
MLRINIRSDAFARLMALRRQLTITSMGAFLTNHLNEIALVDFSK